MSLMTTLLTAILCVVGSTAATRSFIIANDRFVQDGTPMQIAAGEIHYSRVAVEYWEDRLLRVRAMGLNSIQTYVPWNWHVATRGAPDFSGNRNISHFISLAQRVGLLVVVRAGPYMCGEWEFGGFPAWLFENGSVPIRTDASPYIDLALEYWETQLMPQIAPHLYANGGPIIMVQVENEYGSYGDVSKHAADRRYMVKLIASARAALGPSVILMTTDGGSTGYMSRGSIRGPSVYTVGDGCSNAAACDAAQKQFNDPGLSPMFCSECYTGWLTHWGETGANTSSSASHVASILAAPLNGSVSLYLAHGGTNFAQWAGANGGGGSSYAPHETSYDYDSPISEAGEHGYHAGVDKYVAMQLTLAAARNGGARIEGRIGARADGIRTAGALPGDAPPPAEPALPPRVAFGKVVLTESVALFSALAALSPGAPSAPSDSPPTMESMRCPYGFALYSAALPAAGSSFVLEFSNLKDRVQVFVEHAAKAGGETKMASSYSYGGVAYRVNATSISFALPYRAPAGTMVHLLLENMGRINFSHGMDTETKGVGEVTLNGALWKRWTSRCLAFDYASEIIHAPFAASSSTSAAALFQPTLFRGTFHADAIADTFVEMRGWSKGAVWINGFALGRYWQTSSPQKTLFVPGPKLVKGTNTIVVLELHNGTKDASMHFVAEPLLMSWSPSPAPSPVKCDPAAPGKKGSSVRMANESPKLAHQQQWQYNNISGHIALRADPALCLAVVPGCPDHTTSGCIVLAECAQSQPPYGATAFDMEPAVKSPGANHIVTRADKLCLEIDSHDDYQLSPLGVWSCGGAFDQANEWWIYDVVMGHVVSKQASSTPGVPFVATACT